MLTYTTLRNLYGKFTQDTSTDNLSTGDTFLNLATREVITAYQWDFMEASATESTVVAQQFYNTPSDFQKLIDTIVVTIDTTKYLPKESPSKRHWDGLNRQTNFQSDIPDWYFIQKGKLGLYPIPSTSLTDSITFDYYKNFVDLSNADVTTGTITATNGSTAIVGAGTSFTNAMEGRFIKLPDNFWYEIASVTDSTNLVLVKEFSGTTEAGATFIIGETSPLPEQFQILPVYKAAQLYWTPKDDPRAKLYEQMYLSLKQQMIDEHSTKTSSPVIDDGIDRQMINPNLTVTIT